jgi:hypothetical protein
VSARSSACTGAYKVDGAAALTSKKRGRPSSRRLPDALRAEAVGIVREKYGDFRPTLACEKLAEVHGIDVSVETLRQWMIGDGVWLTRARRRSRAHQPRSRRPCLGELVQIDGCNYEWFEARGPRCVLLVYVDDATSRLMQLRFVRSESVILRHGDDELEATAVRKEGRVAQQDVESNKYLGRILDQVRHAQLARDEETLRTGRPRCERSIGCASTCSSGLATRRTPCPYERRAFADGRAHRRTRRKCVGTSAHAPVCGPAPRFEPEYAPRGAC